MPVSAEDASVTFMPAKRLNVITFTSPSLQQAQRSLSSLQAPKGEKVEPASQKQLLQNPSRVLSSYNAAVQQGSAAPPMLAESTTEWQQNVPPVYPQLPKALPAKRGPGMVSGRPAKRAALSKQGHSIEPQLCWSQHKHRTLFCQHARVWTELAAASNIWLPQVPPEDTCSRAAPVHQLRQQLGPKPPPSLRKSGRLTRTHSRRPLTAAVRLTPWRPAAKQQPLQLIEPPSEPEVVQEWQQQHEEEEEEGWQLTTDQQQHPAVWQQQQQQRPTQGWANPTTQQQLLVATPSDAAITGGRHQQLQQAASHVGKAATGSCHVSVGPVTAGAGGGNSCSSEGVAPSAAVGTGRQQQQQQQYMDHVKPEQLQRQPKAQGDGHQASGGGCLPIPEHLLLQQQRQQWMGPLPRSGADPYGHCPRQQQVAQPSATAAGDDPVLRPAASQGPIREPQQQEGPQHEQKQLGTEQGMPFTAQAAGVLIQQQQQQQQQQPLVWQQGRAALLHLQQACLQRLALCAGAWRLQQPQQQPTPLGRAPSPAAPGEQQQAQHSGSVAAGGASGRLDAAAAAAAVAVAAKGVSGAAAALGGARGVTMRGTAGHVGLEVPPGPGPASARMALEEQAQHQQLQPRIGRAFMKHLPTEAAAGGCGAAAAHAALAAAGGAPSHAPATTAAGGFGDCAGVQPQVKMEGIVESSQQQQQQQRFYLQQWHALQQQQLLWHRQLLLQQQAAMQVGGGTAAFHQQLAGKSGAAAAARQQQLLLSSSRGRQGATPGTVAGRNRRSSSSDGGKGRQGRGNAGGSKRVAEDDPSSHRSAAGGSSSRRGRSRGGSSGAAEEGLGAPSSRGRDAWTSLHSSTHIAYKQSLTKTGRFVVRRSRIAQLGLYTTEDIPKGELLLEYVGQVCRRTVADLREQRYKAAGLGNYFFAINRTNVVDATLSGNVCRFINHSCEPNSVARVLTLNSQQRVFLSAAQDIPAGEEITYDYKLDTGLLDTLDREAPNFEQLVAASGLDLVRCGCGAPGCRRYI